MRELDKLKKLLRPGRVYRRADLEKYSKAVDRHLKLLVHEGALEKLSGGLYYCPKTTVFGTAPADDKKLVAAFLKSPKFLLTSPNAYNTLGVGTTQLYNETVVYNKKRHGTFTLGGRSFHFRMKPDFPAKLSPEFLLVDLINNLDRLAENKENVLKQVRKKITALKGRALDRAVSSYGGERTKKFFALSSSTGTVAHG